MEKRKNRKIRELLPIIEAKIAAGQSHSEIEKELGLEGDRPIHNLLKRERRKAARGITGTAKGITIENAKYPLQDGEITCEYQYGVSNEVLPGKTACVTVKDGKLLLIKDL